MKVHKTVTTGRVMKALKRGMARNRFPGFCIACGGAVDGVDPDARGDTCEACGKPAVYGAEELLLELVR